MNTRSITRFAFVPGDCRADYGAFCLRSDPATSPVRATSDGRTPWRDSYRCRSTTDGSARPTIMVCQCSVVLNSLAMRLTDRDDSAMQKITFITEDDQGTVEDAIEAYK